MIRKLMASSAVVALLSAGAFGAQAATQAATPQPAAAQTTSTTDAVGATKPNLTPDQPTLATAFIGRSVYSSENPEADNIGNVNDLIISSDGTISDAVVGVGGFLGIGEKNVAVPFDKLQVVERDGDIRLIYSATKEELQNAPAFDRTAYDPRARNAKNNAAANANAPLAPAANTMATTGAAVGNAAIDAGNKVAAAGAAVTGTGAGAGNTSAGNPGGFMSFNPDQVRASSMIGQSIIGPDNKSIGTVADLVMQPDGNTRAALVDVGGFLGIGSKRVAIPFDQIKVAPDSQNNNEPRLTVAMTRAELEQAPAWQDRTMGSTAAANAANVANANSGAMTSDANQTSATATTATATTATTATAPRAANANDASGSTSGASAQDISANNLIGATVYGQDDKRLGKIGDVVFDPSGQIQAVVVDVGGFLGIGQKPVALQFSALDVRKDDNGGLHLTVNATQDQLRNAPAYDTRSASNG